MKIRELHDWNLSPAEARRLQSELSRRVSLEPAIRFDDVRVVAGVDNGYVRGERGTTAYSVVVALSFPELEVVETRYAQLPVEFPYIPGLLSFREAPTALAAIRQLEVEPDVFLFDAQGYAHFRRFGEASHLGLFVDRPSIGCAKTRLVGVYEEPEHEIGSHRPLIDNGEVVGAAVRTRPGHSPLFVSPGHLTSVELAVRIVVACCRSGQFLPEPTRLAHALITEHTKPFRRPRASRRTADGGRKTAATGRLPEGEERGASDDDLSRSR
ncbi:MAG: endonuclease V [Chloroflexi bacterium]|nr:endonuclease V [Chloroflexota bacterium]